MNVLLWPVSKAVFGKLPQGRIFGCLLLSGMLLLPASAPASAFRPGPQTHWTKTNFHTTADSTSPGAKVVAYLENVDPVAVPAGTAAPIFQDGPNIDIPKGRKIVIWDAYAWTLADSQLVFANGLWIGLDVMDPNAEFSGIQYPAAVQKVGDMRATTEAGMMVVEHGQPMFVLDSGQVMPAAPAWNFPGGPISKFRVGLAVELRNTGRSISNGYAAGAIVYSVE